MVDYLKKLFSKKNPRYVNNIIENRIRAYLKNGRIPWSPGYNEYKWQLISEAINDIEIISAFRNKGLPAGYGSGMDERVVEIPYVIANTNYLNKKVLDAGSALNHVPIIDKLFPDCRELHIFTFETEGYCANANGKRISYTYGDLRELPYRDTYFDTIISVSTIEHIDMDNSIYGHSEKKNTTLTKSYSYLKAVDEMLRVLNIGGQLVITVPFGRFENHGYFQQFDEEMVQSILIRLQSFGSTKVDYIKYEKIGWKFSSLEDCENAICFNPHTGVGRGDDNAAHSRAIAIINFQKHP